MFFYQSDTLDNLPHAKRVMLAGQAFRKALEAKGHSFEGAFDVDAVAGTGRTTCDATGCFPVGLPDALRPWWQAVDKKPLPAVAIAPMDGGTIQVFALPQDTAGFWSLLEKGEGVKR